MSKLQIIYYNYGRDCNLRFVMGLCTLILIVMQCSAFNQIKNLSESTSFIFMPHPRLMLSESQKSDLDDLLQIAPSMKNLNSYIIDESEKIKKQSLIEYKKNGKRLLGVSSEALKRIFYLSYAYGITRDMTFAERAIQEILNVCGFPDWNESHFLDTAEITMAVAIGYDWLYDFLSSEEKAEISNAIEEKAFAYVLYGKGPYYLRVSHNWNSVCNAGMLYGALAIMDEKPEISKRMVEICLQSNVRALKSYQPDGGFPEGYSYWGYGTSFQVMLMDALESLLGYEFDDKDAFLNTGKFVQYMEAPSGDSFNFSDCGPKASGKIPMWWFALKTGDKSLIYSSTKYLEGKNYKFSEKRLLPLILIYASRLTDVIPICPTEKAVLFQGKTPVYIYRSGWDNKLDAYLGVKGGSASTNHAHADAGSFVYEFRGVRWAMDLGSQDYLSLEKDSVDIWNMNQDSQRWDVMRMRNDYHNTLTVDGLKHNVNTKAELIGTFDLSSKKGATVDLTSTLGKINMAHRTVFLDELDYLHVIDSISTNKDSIELKWVMVTPANATIVSKNEIGLSKDGKKMIFTIKTDSCFDIQPQIWQNTPIHEYDAPNPNTCRIGYIARIGKDKNISIEAIIKEE